MLQGNLFVMQLKLGAHRYSPRWGQMFSLHVFDVDQLQIPTLPAISAIVFPLHLCFLVACKVLNKLSSENFWGKNQSLKNFGINPFTQIMK